MAGSQGVQADYVVLWGSLGEPGVGCDEWGAYLGCVGQVAGVVDGYVEVFGCCGCLGHGFMCWWGVLYAYGVEGLDGFLQVIGGEGWAVSEGVCDLID